jgi:phospholipase C
MDDAMAHARVPGPSRNGRRGADGVSRRTLLRGAGAVGLSLALGDAVDVAARLRTRRRPGSLPHPHLPEGTDTLPMIEHVIIVMMENHSFDNYLGMLGRGDGFRLRHGTPTAANPDDTGTPIRAFHMPSTCQLDGHPGQNWNASHLSYGDGRNDGFVRASGPVAMGYWNGDDIPFYYALARTFTLCDRWFGSCLAQTYPNRRFLLAGTAAGIVSTSIDALTAPAPPNGNIMERLDAHGISWRDYYSDLPGVGVLLDYALAHQEHLSPIAQYFTDAAAGTLPAVSFVDPVFDMQSEENPQDIQVGEEFASRVINAAMAGPGWPHTLLIWLYDEHGGYYDHVPPPRAVPPDDIPPDIDVPPDFPGGYDRYGFRVPAVIVSPWSRPHHVSHRVRDHTAVLKLIETKWNLPALTLRDANANDLLDCLDFRRAAFREPPTLPAPGLVARPTHCTPGDPGPIPPALTSRIATGRGFGSVPLDRYLRGAGR